MKPISNSYECPKCGSEHKSKPFCLYDNGWYCFSCGYTKAADRGFTPKIHKIAENIIFPECTNDVSVYSVEAMLFLTKYGITNEDIYKHKILFCEKDNSLLYPIINEDNITGWQKRNMKERFITGEGSKIPTIFNEHNSNICILVEDYISAIRVSKQYNVVCLWGTKISYEYLSKLYQKFDIIVTWLDNDAHKECNSGQEAVKIIHEVAEICCNKWKNKRGFSVNCKEIVNILTDHDPKVYTDTDIRLIIEDVLSEQKYNTNGSIK